MTSSHQQTPEASSGPSALLEEESALYASLLANRLSLKDNGAGRCAFASSSSAWGQKSTSWSGDEKLARQIAREEAVVAARFDADLALAQSLADDTETRRLVMTRSWVAHQVAVAALAPRRTAVAPEPLLPPPGQPNTGNTNNTNAPSTTSDLVQLSPLVSRPSSPLSELSSTTVTQKRLTGNKCVACQETIQGDEIQTPCKHHYDKECILNLFDASTRDESLFPPSCCSQPIPVRMARPFMTETALAKFNRTSKEYRTLKRVYCSNPTCSCFLGPQLGRVGWLSRPFLTCPTDECTAVTCARCKASVTCTDRFRHKCKFDQENQDVLALGQRSGWARCPGCSQLVELNRGCNHMTCRCNTQFCYVCQARWKTCICPRWEGNDPVAVDRRRRFAGGCVIA